MRRLLPLFLLLLPVVPFQVKTAQAAVSYLDDEAEPACNVSFSLQKSGAGDFSLLFDAQDTKNAYIFDASSTSASFSILKDGQKRQLATAPVAWQAAQSVTLQRRPWLMRLLVDGRVVLSAFDATYQSGKIGLQSAATGAGWTWKDARVQPVEPIRFDDDFTRTGGEGDVSWTPASGKWALSASSQRITARNANMSSNPFAFEASAPSGSALATAGRAFWDSYDARVATRPAGTGTVGIAGYVQDPKNYLAFLWDGRESAKSRRLVRVQDGVTTVLATAAGAFLPRQWYEIGLRTSPGSVEALIDGVPILRTRDDAFGQGGVGLIAQNLEAAAFDDVKVRSYDFYRQNLTDQSGAWTTNGAFRLTGLPSWNTYRLIASPRADADGAFGLLAGFKDAQNYSIFRAAPAKASVAFKGRQQIVRFEGGTAKILSDAPISPELSGEVRLTLSAQNGALSIAAGEHVIAQAAQANLTAGQTGVWNAASFAPETVLYLPPVPDAPKVADRMEGDAYMVGWASATGEWPPTAGENGLEFWNTGEFFGDASLEFPWRASYSGSLEVALRARRGQFASGTILRGESSADHKTVKWSLLRDDKTLSSAVVPIPAASVEDETGSPFLLKVALQGQSILLFAGDTPILSALETDAPTGHALGVRAQGFRVRAERLHAQSVNRDDYTFTGAPTDFYAPQGKWSIFSRWPCYGDWSFFGGQGLNPVLWSKRTYSGDIVAEMYAHPQMILPKEPGYAHPGDLNLTLCGDGKNPSSGYSFVVAGWDNTRSKLLRGSQVLAENHGNEAFFHETFNQNMQWHRKWFYIRAQAIAATKDGKDGVQLTLLLDDRSILSAFDPNPLPTWNRGGHVAFWTVDSTLMIARAKIEAEHLGAKALPVGLLDATPAETAPATAAGAATLQPVPTIVGDAASSLVARDESGWNVQNPVAGGFFEAKLNRAPLSATPQSQISFDAQIPAGVHIDAYCVIDGNRFTLDMTGNQLPDPSAPSLGAMTRVALPGEAGATWNFDLGAALAKRFPGQKSWKIDSLSLGARQGDNYRWLGFGGNDLGARYHLSNLKWN